MCRFTIRDMLWLTVVVAMFFAWMAHLRALNHKVAKDFEEAIRFGRKADISDALSEANAFLTKQIEKQQKLIESQEAELAKLRATGDNKAP